MELCVEVDVLDVDVEVLGAICVELYKLSNDALKEAGFKTLVLGFHVSVVPRVSQ